MGSSLSMDLVYGYRLGSEHEEWLVSVDPQADKSVVEWFATWDMHDSDGSEDELEELSLPTLMVATYLDRMKLPRGEYSFQDDSILEKNVGITIELQYWGDYTEYFLCAHPIKSYDPVAEIDPTILQQDTTVWDTALAQFLSVLGIRSTQEKPAWWMAASYG